MLAGIRIDLAIHGSLRWILILVSQPYGTSRPGQHFSV